MNNFKWKSALHRQSLCKVCCKRHKLCTDWPGLAWNFLEMRSICLARSIFTFIGFVEVFRIEETLKLTSVGRSINLSGLNKTFGLLYTYKRIKTWNDIISGILKIYECEVRSVKFWDIWDFIAPLGIGVGTAGVYKWPG